VEMNLYGVHFIEASVQQITNASADYAKETAVQKNCNRTVLIILIRKK